MQLNREATTPGNSGPAFQRKFAVEFLNNVEALKKKTSNSKKTCRALFAFFTERIATEQAYAARLAALAKNGGVTVSFGYSYSIVDYKNNEETSLQNALNAMLDFTIQESEFHKNYAEEIKEKVLQPLHDVRVKLSREKENWLYAMEALKKNLVNVQEKLKQEQLKLKGITQEIESIKERKRKAMGNIGLDPTEEIALENLPGDIQKLERMLMEKTKKKKEVTDTCEASTTSASQAEDMYKEKMKRILGIIEQNEGQRIGVLRQVLKASNEVYTKTLKRKSTLCEMAGNVYVQVNPFNDIQGYIRKDSLCSTSEEELRRMYKDLGEELVLPGKEKGGVASDRQAVKKSMETEQQKGLSEKIKKETATLKHLRLRVGRIEELYKLYPNTSMLKRLNIHPDLKCEDPAALRAFIYLLLRLSTAISANKSSQPGLFRSTLNDKSLPKSSETVPTQTSPVSKKEATKGKLEKIMVDSWKLPEAQVNYVTELLKVGGEGFKLKATDLRSTGLHFALIFLLQKWQRALPLDEKAQESAVTFFRAVYSFAWSYMFWQIFNKTCYKDDEFESESANVVQLLEFNSYMSEASLVTNAQFAEYTVRMLQGLGKAGRYDLCPSTPAALSIFRTFIGPFLVDERERRLLPTDFDQLMEDTQPLCEILGVEHEWSFVYLINFIGETYLTTTDFSKSNESQTKAIHALLSIKKHLEGNYVTFLTSSKLKSADLIVPASSEESPAAGPTEWQLREKAQKSGVLFGISERINATLLDFVRNFGGCVNKLKAMLELGKLAHSLCFTLGEEIGYETVLEQVLETNGQHVLDGVLEKHKRPFVLLGKEGETSSTITDILQVFKFEIEKFISIYFSVWHEYLSHPQSHYTKPMREVLIKDLQNQAGLLSVDSNNSLFTAISVSVHDFDLLCQSPNTEATTSALLPIVQAWFLQKSTMIEETMRNNGGTEQWNAKNSGGLLFTDGAVNVAHYLFHTVETLKQFIGDKSLSVWPGAIKEFVGNVAKEYCDSAEKTCQCDKQFLPGPLPSLLLANRKKLLMRVTKRSREEVKGIEQVFNSNWDKYLPRDTNVISLCSLLSNLCFLDEQIVSLEKAFLPSKEIDVSDIHSRIKQAIQRVAEFLAYKLAFVDLGNTVFHVLYTGENGAINTMASGLYKKLDVFKVLRKKVPARALSKVLEALLKGLMHGWLYYMLVFLTNMKAEELKDLSAVVKDDMQQMRDFFCTNDPNDSFKGLAAEYVQEQIKPMGQLIQYVKIEDNTLIGLFKNVSAQDEPSKELISRILFGRGTKDVERFFELYKNILIK